MSEKISDIDLILMGVSILLQIEKSKLATKITFRKATGSTYKKDSESLELMEALIEKVTDRLEEKEKERCLNS